MRKNGKKLLSLALSLVMAIALLPTAALADRSSSLVYYQEVPGGTITYRADTTNETGSGIDEILWSGEWYVAGCSDGVTKADIQANVSVQIGGKEFSGPVVFVSPVAFINKTSLTSVTIPEGVTRILYDAFSGCTGLTSVTLPDSLTFLDSGSFHNCSSLTSIVIPDNVTEICSSTFSDCSSLASVTFPANLTTIERAFGNCTSLTSVSIPSSVTKIRWDTFEGCTGLKDIYYSGTEEQWNAIDKDGSKDLMTGNTIYTIPTVHFSSSTPTQPTQKLADAREQKVVINGSKTITFHAFGLKDANGNYTNYVSVRDLAWAMNGGSGEFDVTWDNAAKAIDLVTGKGYSDPTGNEGKQLFTGPQPYSQDPVKILVDGREVKLELINIGNGNTYYKLRDLGEQLGFTVGWDQAAGAATIITN